MVMHWLGMLHEALLEVHVVSVLDLEEAILPSQTELSVQKEAEQ